MFVVVWEPSNGRGGGHQVALAEDRAEIIHRAISRAMPGVECRIERAEGFGPGGAPALETRQERRPDRRRAAGERARRLPQRSSP